jgi:hypothetical protein
MPPPNHPVELVNETDLKRRWKDMVVELGNGGLIPVKIDAPPPSSGFDLAAQLATGDVRGFFLSMIEECLENSTGGSLVVKAYEARSITVASQAALESVCLQMTFGPEFKKANDAALAEIAGRKSNWRPSGRTP